MEGGFPQEQRFAVFKVLSKKRDFQFSKFSQRTEIFSFHSFSKSRDSQFSRFSQRAEVLSFLMCCSSRAFLALLHHHRPELVDLSRMEERDTITNCTEAFAIAEVSRDGGLV